MISLTDRSDIKKKLQDRLYQIFSKENFLQHLGVLKKEDQSPLTEIDIFVSDCIKELIEKNEFFKKITFYSEEDHDQLEFPCAILDPIDGTRELVKGIPECALSLAIMPSPALSNSWGWIFNPFSGFEVTTGDRVILTSQKSEGKKLGLVSRSEWKRGLFSDLVNENIILGPKGSIAFKLGLLATGACDFVYSRRPKNIWDIAAGTILCEQRGIKLYCQGKLVTELKEKKIDGPLLWCHPSLLDELKGLI